MKIEVTKTRNGRYADVEIRDANMTLVFDLLEANERRLVAQQFIHAAELLLDGLSDPDEQEHNSHE